MNKIIEDLLKIHMGKDVSLEELEETQELVIEKFKECCQLLPLTYTSLT